MPRNWKKNKVVGKAPGLPFAKILFVESRLFLGFFLQLVSNLAIPDHNADAFKSVPKQHKTVIDHLFGGFKRWDSIHFLHIAEYGYTFENNLAFFPLYPILVRTFTDVWRRFLPIFDLSSSLLLSGVLINWFAFFGAGYALYLLTKKLLNDPLLAYLSLLIFAVNPASVFFSSCYSESLYAFLTWTGLYLLYREKGRDSGLLESAIFFGMALITRSNGLLNCGFIAYIILCRCLLHLRSREYAKIVGLIAFGSFLAITILLPFFYLQYSHWMEFCREPRPMQREIAQLAANMNYTVPGNAISWCNQSVPISYTAIQAKYWSVGFLGYFQLRKLPCFVLALPALLISYAGIVRYVGSLRKDFEVDEHSLLPFLVHTVVLLVSGLFFMNVEVYTRFLFSATPFPYWFLAVVIKENLSEEAGTLDIRTTGLFSACAFLWKHSKPVGRLILVYVMLYAVLGTILHVNFLPWT